MKRIRRLTAFCLVVLLLLSTLPGLALAADAISITQAGIVAKGGSKLLAISGAAASDVTWTSSDESKATVDANGVVTGLKVGSVTITATLKSDASVTATAKIFVTNGWTYAVDWAGTYTAEYNNAVTTAPVPIVGGQFDKIWDAPVGEGAIAIVNDYIYTYNGVSGGGVTNAGTFYKVHKDTGEIVDSLYLGVDTGNYYSYTFYGNGLLYISCPTALMCVDPETFTLLWKTTHADQSYCSAQLVNGFIVTNGLVYNAVTGVHVKNLKGIGNYSWANGAEVDGYFYVASGNELYAFDTTEWEMKDSIKFTTGKGSGVIYHNSRLYWGAGSTVCSVKVSDGVIDDETLLTYAWGYSITAPPVALGSRVYFVGNTTDGNFGTGIGAIGVFDTASLSLQYNGLLEGSGHKLQTVPILRSVTSGGNVVAGEKNQPASADVADAPQTSTAYIFVQDYANPSAIYMMSDTAGQKSGSPEKLFALDPANFAFEQMACDKDGALYCVNDSGYLMKYGKPDAAVPVISNDLTVDEKIYNLGATASALSITASVSEGTLSYQWQSHNGNGVFADISGAKSAKYTPPTSTAGTMFYRCVVTNTVSGVSAKAYSKIAKITVNSRGDMDGSGKLDANDAVCLRKYLAGMNVGSANADVNNDGVVNLLDLILLRRYLGWGEPLP